MADIIPLDSGSILTNAGVLDMIKSVIGGQTTQDKSGTSSNTQTSNQSTTGSTTSSQQTSQQQTGTQSQTGTQQQDRKSVV